MYHSGANASLILTLAVCLIGCGTEPLTQLPAPDPNDEGDITSIKLDFERGGNHLKLTADEHYLHIESNGLPEHDPMEGIDASNDLVPLPQQYQGENDWKIPLKPRKSLKPVHIEESFYRGVIAIAINGVPIVSPLNEELIHSFNPNELDNFGGHCGCGRGDEYHYHLAPIHLESIVGNGNPIAYALDGYPIFGFYDRDGNEPTGLDKYQGRVEEGSYRYYSSREFPYVNGGLRGTVEIRNGQVFPQPASWPVRSDNPSYNVAVSGWSFDPSKQTYRIEYLGGSLSRIEYSLKNPDTAEFKKTDLLLKTTIETLSRSSQPETTTRRKETPKRPTTILRVPNGFSGTVFFIEDSSAPALKPQFGRLRIDIPDDGVVQVPDLQLIGDHYSVYAEFFDGTKINSETRNRVLGGSWVEDEWVPAKQFGVLSDGGSGSKKNAEGRMVNWRGFHIGKSESRGVLPDFPPGL